MCRRVGVAVAVEQGFDLGVEGTVESGGGFGVDGEVPVSDAVVAGPAAQ